MRLCVLGGSPSHPGGLEAFCARALKAIELHGGAWSAIGQPSDSAYLSPASLGGLGRGLVRLRGEKQEGLDLVWLQFSNLADLLYLIWARLLGLPVLVTPHLGANSRLQRSKPLRWLSAKILTLADGLALLFEGQEREIRLPDGVPRTVIRTFLPEASLSAGSSALNDHPLRLIHASRLSEGKGSFRMLDLCAELRRRKLDFSARIVGSGEPDVLARLQERIAQLNLGSHVTLEGWLAEEPMLAALSDADLLIHLSSLDSFPLIVLEAMAMDTLPVVMDMAGVRAMVSCYDGVVVPPDDPVIRACEALMDLPVTAIRTHAAASGERVRADYAWRAATTQLIRVLDETMARAGRHGKIKSKARAM